MKLTWILLLSLSLAACAPWQESPTGTGSSSSSARSMSSAATVGRERAQEGELCGGIAGFLCDEGLSCVYEGDYPDAAGTCVRGTTI